MKKNLMTRNQGGRSVAVWGQIRHSSHATPKAPTLNVHFNYWHVKSQKNSDSDLSDFFDIGIMVHSCRNLSKVWVYIPAIFEISDFQDLGNLFSDPIIASGIFNESLSATIPPNTSHITLNDGEDLFARVYLFQNDETGKLNQNEIKISKEGNGTIIEISQNAIDNACNEITEDSSVYFRFRVKVPKNLQSPFSRKITPADSWLLSSFEYTEFLDFRLNEARNLPQSINQKMRAGDTPIIRVDYLLVVGDSADVAGGVDSNKKRLLESELWEKYTASGGGKSLSDGMVIHHWKKVSTSNSDIGDFSAFIKLKSRRSGSSLIWRYLLVVALIGSLGSLIASFAWSGFGLENWVK